MLGGDILRRKHFLLFLVLFVIITFSGCGSKKDKDIIKHSYIYKGENENWTGTYTLDATEVFETIDGVLTYDNQSNSSVLVTYKGELSKLSKARKVEITYNSSKNSGKIVNNYDLNQPIFSKEFKMLSGGRGAALLKEDDIINIEINIDGTIDTFELKTDAK